MSNRPIKKQSLPAGQSMSEYSFAIALISVVAIGSLTVLGSHVNGLLSGMVTHRSATSTPLSTPPSRVTSPLPPPSAGAANLQLTLSDGSTLQVPNYPFNTAELVDLAGIDGTTQKYAQSLTDFAAILQQAGKIDANQAALLRKLADQGFMFGTQQTVILNAYKNTRNNQLLPSELNSAYLSYGYGTFEQGGQPVSADQIREYIANPRKPLPEFTEGENINKLTSAYDEVVKAGLLTDPAIRQIVDHSYDEILRANYAVLLETKLQQSFLESSTSTAQQGLSQSADLNTSVGASIRKTQTSSTDVCTTGQGDGSSLVQCELKG